jgi:hypothetical protein
MWKQFFLLFAFFLTACTHDSLPMPIQANIGEEFTLTPGHSVTIPESDLTITLLSVPTDGRCPLEIECAESGPVTVVVTAQFDSSTTQEFVFQTFTDDSGNVPEIDFQGMQTSIEVGDVVIRMSKVLPFPKMSAAEIKPAEYLVSFLLTK